MNQKSEGCSLTVSPVWFGASTERTKACSAPVPRVPPPTRPPGAPRSGGLYTGASTLALASAAPPWARFFWASSGIAMPIATASASAMEAIAPRPSINALHDSFMTVPPIRMAMAASAHVPPGNARAHSGGDRDWTLTPGLGEHCLTFAEDPMDRDQLFLAFQLRLCHPFRFEHLIDM